MPRFPGEARTEIAGVLLDNLQRRISRGDAGALPACWIIRLAENLGYAGNNNVGIRAALDAGRSGFSC